jgi:NitT/TauT family transport system substrate-binding protein
VAASALIALSACSSGSGGSPTPSTTTDVAAAAGTPSSARGASAGVSQGASSSPTIKPEKSSIKIADFTSGLFIPVQVAQASGTFKKYGLDVSATQLTSSAATAALVSGQIDFYLGGAAAIAAHVHGADIIYVGDMIDKTAQWLEVSKDIHSFADLKGKKIAVGQPGAFGDILIRKLADENGLKVGSDIQELYNNDDAAENAELLTGKVSAAIVSSPANEQAEAQGAVQLIDFSKDPNSRLIAPGMAVSRKFAEANPNTVKAFISGYLEGLKRALDDPTYAKSVFAKAANLSDQSVIDSGYTSNAPLWNKDLTVPESPISLVLKYTSALKNTSSFQPSDFYDNSYVKSVNATLGHQLFPNDIPAS